MKPRKLHNCSPKTYHVPCSATSEEELLTWMSEPVTAYLTRESKLDLITLFIHSRLQFTFSTKGGIRYSDIAVSSKSNQSGLGSAHE